MDLKYFELSVRLSQGVNEVFEELVKDIYFNREIENYEREMKLKRFK